MTEPPNTRDMSVSTLRFAPPLETKLLGRGPDEGVIAGYASLWGGPPDAFGDIIARGAYAATIAEHKAAGTMPVMLFSHDMARPVGRWEEMREDDFGLHVQGRLNLETAAGREVHAHLKARDISGLSIGFRLAENGFKRQPDGTRALLSIDLAEISLVALPAARRARVTEVKSLQSPRDLERFLHDEAGLPRAAARAVAAKGFSGLNTADDDAAAAALAQRIEAATREIKSLDRKSYDR